MSAAFQDARRGAVDAVQHAQDPGAPATPPSGPPSRSCARCGGPVPSGRGALYCAPACRFAAVRERRALARADLLAALNQLAEVTRRVERALRVLGLNPTKPRQRRTTL